MAPSRTTKTTSQSISRQDKRRQQTQESDDLEELDADNDMAATIDSEAHEEEQDELQGTSMEILMSKMVNTQRKRHALKKQTIIKSYNTASKHLRNSINNTFDEHEENAAAAHKAQLTRLQELLAYKVQLETELASKLVELKQTYAAHSLDLESVIKYRVKELTDMRA